MIICLPMSVAADGRKLAKILRHRGELEHDSHGWFSISVVLEVLGWDEEHLLDVVHSNTRFQVSDDHASVRALHGHSFEVEYDGCVPPDILYHGTSDVALEKI